MTDLPPIPDQAVEAALRDMGYTDSMIEAERRYQDDSPMIRQTLTAAWPHLYAAALHHASARLNDEPGFRCCTPIEADAVAAELRDWAEALVSRDNGDVPR